MAEEEDKELIQKDGTWTPSRTRKLMMLNFLDQIQGLLNTIGRTEDCFREEGWHKKLKSVMMILASARDDIKHEIWGATVEECSQFVSEE